MPYCGVFSRGLIFIMLAVDCTPQMLKWQIKIVKIITWFILMCANQRNFNPAKTSVTLAYAASEKFHITSMIQTVCILECSTMCDLPLYHLFQFTYSCSITKLYFEPFPGSKMRACKSYCIQARNACYYKTSMSSIVQTLVVKCSHWFTYEAQQYWIEIYWLLLITH